MRHIKIYPLIYNMLLEYGHSRHRAEEIIAEAKVGNKFQLTWIKSVFRCRHGDYAKGMSRPT